MKHSLINIALFAGFMAAMVGIQALPGADDHGYEHEVAREELTKQQREERFAKAAQEVCGPNAAWKLTHKHGEVICMNKRGRQTKVAQL